MNGRDFLDTARHLAGLGGEANHRSAVSRAYYAAFHAARDLVTSLRFWKPRADRAHNYLYVRLNNFGEVQVQSGAFLLNKLRGLRNQADYDIGQPLSQADAVKSVRDADRILQAFDSLIPAQRVQITSAIKQYEQQIGDVTWMP
jgi:uncharacterized protein (UPF0332 family)